MCIDICGIPFNLRVSPVYSYTDLLLKDAKEADEAIANGTAQLYETPDELFDTWERESKLAEQRGFDLSLLNEPIGILGKR